VRIETSDARDGFFLVEKDAAYFVVPARRMFMDAKQSSRLTQSFVPVDPNDPCAAWQRMAEIAGAADQGSPWRCDRVGAEMVDGRDTMKYRMTAPRQPPSDRWIDPRLGFPIRVQAEDGSTAAIENLQEGPQPLGLFVIPGDYRKFDPEQLIEHIKQSDVWVEPAK
jgi:hypothetical protein